MIQLRAMTAQEYPDYCDYFIDDYSREIAENSGCSILKAIELAKTIYYLVSQTGSSVIGYLWHSIKQSEKPTFIYDFFIFPKHRNNGYGTLALEALETQMKSAGIKQIKLRVAYYNQRALKLYQEVGFTITGFNMLKKIDS
ncbi:MAG: GNAT family N-acetyltransferase [Saccharospirillaceae bacterium]|nr:GNAT family N-acetyltransferase [Pseudomonadales bacterium]NRB81294.1 GNAT family N-acetyltransferase [Saccharospirillaceae bacterium]